MNFPKPAASLRVLPAPEGQEDSAAALLNIQHSALTMDLILWRHAEAEETVDGVDDPLRGLTPKGERHARRVAEWLNRFLPETTRVL